MRFFIIFIPKSVLCLSLILINVICCVMTVIPNLVIIFVDLKQMFHDFYRLRFVFLENIIFFMLFFYYASPYHSCLSISRTMTIIQSSINLFFLNIYEHVYINKIMICYVTIYFNYQTQFFRKVTDFCSNANISNTDFGNDVKNMFRLGNRLWFCFIHIYYTALGFDFAFNLICINLYL